MSAEPSHAGWRGRALKSVGLQEDLDRLHEQLRIALATARSTTPTMAAIQLQLLQAAATALTRQVVVTWMLMWCETVLM